MKSPLVLLNVLRRMESRGATEKAKKVRQRCSEVFRYAIVTGRAEYNPAADLTSAMSGHESKHYPFLPLRSYQTSLKPLWLYRQPVNCSCRTFADPYGSSYRRASRCFVSLILKSGVGNSAERMKMKRPHLVPLSPKRWRSYSSSK